MPFFCPPKDYNFILLACLWVAVSPDRLPLTLIIIAQPDFACQGIFFCNRFVTI
jgi:hypothetical protein